MLSCYIVLDWVTPAPPAPPGPGPGPAPAACVAAENEHCPGLGGTGAETGGACYNCVKAHDKAFQGAGCYTSGSGGRHKFVQSFCGGSTE